MSVSPAEFKALKARCKKLEEELSLEREQTTNLTKWIQETLRPGIEALKSSMKQRVERLEKQLDEERKNGSLWINDKLGPNQEKLKEFIAKTVQRELSRQRAINRSYFSFFFLFSKLPSFSHQHYMHHDSS